MQSRMLGCPHLRDKSDHKEVLDPMGGKNDLYFYLLPSKFLHYDFNTPKVYETGTINTIL